MRITGSRAGIDLEWDLHCRELAIQQRWQEGQYTNARWQIIRDAYSLRLPHILQTGTTPYFLDWWNTFTPIEQNAWQDIRGLGLRLYPQFPALRYFIDFADPVLQIGVELDGKDFHDEHKDRARDAELWQYGWRIFRVPGRQSLRAPKDLFEELHAIRQEYGEEEAHDRLTQWGRRWSEGFFWALKAIYYGRKPSEQWLRDAAYRILDRHRYEQFAIDPDEREE